MSLTCHLLNQNDLVKWNSETVVSSVSLFRCHRWRNISEYKLLPLWEESQFDIFVMIHTERASIDHAELINVDLKVIFIKYEQKKGILINVYLVLALITAGAIYSISLLRDINKNEVAIRELIERVWIDDDDEEEED